MTKKASNTDYFDLRMEQIGFDEKVDFAHFETMPNEVNSKVKHPLFWPDEDGNICIGLIGLDGTLLGYNEKDNTKHMQAWRPIHWKRLRQPFKGTKYLPCKKGLSVIPYIPKTLVQKYLKGERVRKLIITEGYIKAFVGAKHGLHIIGLPGITVWKPKQRNQIFKQIELIVKVCQVQEIIFLTDADTLDVTWEENKDLSKRPNSFFNAVRLFKYMCADFERDLFFTHIISDSPYKGLDDLLIGNKNNVDDICKELRNKTPKKKYFTPKMDCVKSSTGKIKSYFHILDAKSFYKQYEEQIRFKKFIFRGHEYQYDDDLEELVQKRVADASRFLQIGGTIFQKGGKPTKQSTIENVLVPIKREQLLKIFCDREDYRIYAKRVWEQMEYYDGAINIPDNKEASYKEYRIIENKEGHEMKWKNLYHQISWSAKQGSCELSLNFVKHIFGTNTVIHEGKEYNEYELGLDYIKLLWDEPKQKLPILCLLSEDRHTGKSTFWDWMRLIFQQNMRFVRSDQLTGQFTSYWASKLLIVIDEAMIEKQHTVERIKALSTANTFEMEGKFTNGEEIVSYLKIGLASNKIFDFMRIDDEETRFWLRKVPEVPSENRIHDLLDKLCDEIPAFLHFLENRKYVTNNESRSWFHENLLATETLKLVKGQSKWDVEKMIEDTMMDLFGVVQQPILKYQLSELHDLIDDQKMNKSTIKAALVKKLKKEPSSPSSYIFYKYNYGQGLNNDSTDVISMKKKGRYYTFYADEYYKGKDLFDVCGWYGLLELEKKGRDIKFEENKKSWLNTGAFIKNVCDYISSEDVKDVFEGFNDQKSVQDIASALKAIAPKMHDEVFKKNSQVSSII